MQSYLLYNTHIFRPMQALVITALPLKEQLLKSPNTPWALQNCKGVPQQDEGLHHCSKRLSAFQKLNVLFQGSSRVTHLWSGRIKPKEHCQAFCKKL